MLILNLDLYQLDITIKRNRSVEIHGTVNKLMNSGSTEGYPEFTIRIKSAAVFLTFLQSLIWAKKDYE